MANPNALVVWNSEHIPGHMVKLFHNDDKKLPMA